MKLKFYKKLLEIKHSSKITKTDIEETKKLYEKIKHTLPESDRQYYETVLKLFKV